MKIEKIELLQLDLPMNTSFQTSFGVLSTKQTVIVKLYTDKGIGYGESASFNAPLYNYETVDTCMYILEKFAAPAVIGKEFNSVEDFVKEYKFVVGHNIAKSGLEFSFWDVKSQVEGKSLKQLFGGVQSKIVTGESVGIKDSVEATFKNIEEALERGYQRIKLKIKPGWDVELVEKIRDKWPDIDLMVDGNSAYNLEEHVDIFKKLEKFNLTMIEQPLAEDDIIDHATLQKEIETPVCLDESITSAEDARKALEIKACKIINIKPGRVGGALESIKIHDLCQKQGIGVWNGGMLETGIGRAFNIALASKENYIYPADMSPFYDFYSEDIVEDSFDINPDGTVDVRDVPGLGYKVDEKKIEKYTLRKVEIKK